MDKKIFAITELFVEEEFFNMNEKFFDLQKFATPISLTSGNDNYSNSTEKIVIKGLGGNDKISNYAFNATVQTGAGDDSVYNSGYWADIQVGDGDNTVSNVSGGYHATITSGSGNDKISNYAMLVTIKSGTGNDSIYNSGDHSSLVVGDGVNTIYNSSSATDSTIKTGDGNDSISNYASYMHIDMGDGDNTLYNDATGWGETIYSGSGKDSISSKYRATVFSGSGNDTISVGAGLLDAGDGDDIIKVQTYDQVTVVGGKGDDTIQNSKTPYGYDYGHIYKYKAGDGDDVITGFNKKDTIEISGSTYSTVTSGNDIVIKIGSGSITLKNAKGTDFVIDCTEGSGNDSIITGTSGADFITNTIGSAVISALAGNDTIVNSGSNVSISGGADSDIISIEGNARRTTIYGGKASDTIYSNGNANIFQYNSGDGADVIYGFSNEDSIQIKSGSITGSVKSGSDITFYVGNGTANSITFKDMAEGAFTISDDVITFKEDTGVINLTSKNDKYFNDADDATIMALGGNDTITNAGSNVYIDGGAGADRVSMVANASGGMPSHNTVVTGDGNDVIYNAVADESYIDAGAANDTIQNGGNIVQMYGGAGNDKIDNTGHEATIYGGDGKDTIISNGTDGYIDGGADADKISLGADARNTTIIGGKGDDTIYLNDEANLVQYANGDGKDLIVGFSKDDSLQITNGTMDTALSGSNIILTVGSNKITLKGIADEGILIEDNVLTLGKAFTGSVVGTSKGDTLKNSDDKSTISALGGADVITNSGNSVYISAGEGNDKVTDSGSENKIYGDAGNDTIIASGNNNLIDGGAGNDKISIGADVENATLTGGAGNDTIYLNDNANLYNYASGKDTIYNFSKGDSIKVDGTIRQSVTSGSNLTVYVGSDKNNAITIRDVKDEKFIVNDNVITLSDEVIKIVSGSAKADNLTNTDDGFIVDALAGNDIIKNSGDQVSISGGAGNDKISITGGANNTITADAGNDTIYSNGAANLIQYSNGDGNDVIVGFSKDDSLQIDGTIKNSVKSGSDFIVTVGSGKITFKGLGSESFQNDNGIITIADEVGPKTLTAGKDNYVNDSDGETIYAIGGVDTIKNTANNSYIDGGDGNDKISLSASASNNTLIGGAGNDTIYTNGEGNIIQYASGDGKDVIFGFGGHDSIIIDGTISKTVKSGSSDIGVAVGNSTITVKDAMNKNLAIENGVIAVSSGPVPVSLTTSADKYVNENANATIYADKGNDTLTNTASSVYIDAGAGNDKISLSSSAGTNTIGGGAGNDTIYTNGNGNLIQYTSGKDVIVGFSGDDSIKVAGTISSSVNSGSDKVFKVGSNTITIKDGASKNFAIDNGVIVINDIVGLVNLTTGADKYENVDSNATIYADKGNDTITNTAENNLIDGGAGNDKISLGSSAGNNTITGGAGNDTIYTNGNGNLIEYANGKDVIVGFSGDDSIKVAGTIRSSVNSSGNKVITVGSGSSNVITIKGGASLNLGVTDGVIEIVDGPVATELTTKGDKYTNADSKSTIYALAGNDTIVNNGSSSYIDLGAGADKAENSADEVTILGGDGNDVINSSGKSNSLSGGAGNDKISLESDAEDSTIIGGAGNDTIYLNDGNSNIVQYVSGKDVIYGFGETDSIKLTSGSISKSVMSGESMVFTISSGNIITIKDALNKTFTVENGIITATEEEVVGKSLTAKAEKYVNENTNETVYALAGNDTVTNNGGAAYIDLGEGADKGYNYANEVTMVGGVGNDTIINSGNDGAFEGNEGNDKISLGGTATNNTITAGAGNDTIYSNANGNIFQYESGDGNDVIIGFGGDDSLIVEDFNRTVVSGANVVVYSGSASNNTITLKDFKSNLSIEDGVITVGENDTSLIEGSANGDNLINEKAGVTISALGGADTVENSGNSVSISAGAGNDKVTNSGNEVTISGDAGNDTIESEGNSIYIIGGEGSDVISLGSDVENATISGGKANDIIYGNDNAVIYQYASGDGNDVIYGFTTNDTLQLTGVSVSTVSSNGDNGILKVGSSYITLGGAGTSEVNIITDGVESTIDFSEYMPVGVSVNSAGTAMSVSTKFTGSVVDLTKYKGADDVERVNASALIRSVSIIGNAIDNSIVAGKGDDTLFGGDGADTLTGGGGADVFIYSKGDDFITDYTTGKDTIMLDEDVKVDSAYTNEKDFVMVTNRGHLTIKNGIDTELTVVDYEGNSVDVSAEISYLIDDDNFETSELQISSISEITATNYSVGKLEDSASFGNLTNDTLAAVYTYTDK